MHTLKFGYFSGLTLLFISGCAGFQLETLQNDQAQKPIENQEHLRDFYHKPHSAVPYGINVDHESLSRKTQETSVNPNPTSDDLRLISLNPWIRKGPEGLIFIERLRRAAADDNPDSKIEDPPPSSGEVTPGAPPPDAGAAPEQTEKGGSMIWEQHKWFFIIVLIFFVISMILLAICLSCTLCKCRGRGQQQHQPIKSLEEQQLQPEQHLSSGVKQPLDNQEEPLLSVTVVKPAMAQAPTQGEAPPQSTQDDENGWIIPMDQLTQEELRQTEVPLTKF